MQFPVSALVRWIEPVHEFVSQSRIMEVTFWHFNELLAQVPISGPDVRHLVFPDCRGPAMIENSLAVRCRTKPGRNLLSIPASRFEATGER